MTLAVDGVFDIECEDWDKFVIGACLWNTDDGEDYFETRDPDEWYDALLSRGGTMWGHYAGYYDTLLALSIARKRGDRATCSLQGPRVSRATIKGTTLRDSHALVPMPLSVAALMGDDPQYKKDDDTGLPCVCDESKRLALAHAGKPLGCGGYCSIKQGMPEAYYRKVSDYLRHDCKALLYGCMLPLVERARAFGFPLKGTVGGTAWGSIQAELAIPDIAWQSPQLYHLVERAKRGGRCEVFDTGPHLLGYAHDVKAAYPAALERVPVPVGDCIVIRGVRARSAFDRELPGIYHAAVNVAEQHIPPLPTSVEGAPCYPWGRFKDAWTLPELRHAVEDGDTKVEAIEWAVIWEDTDTPLAPWMRKWWAERARTEKTSPTWSKWLKWKVNSATGKLGQDPRGETVMLNPDFFKVKACPGTCPPKRHYCGAWRFIADGIFAAPRWRLPEHGYLHWNAYLTSGQRVELHTGITSDGEGGISSWYTDTDSLLAGFKLKRNVGTDLGQWEYQGMIGDYFAHAPKAYGYRQHGETLVGQWVTRLKGVPRASRDDLANYVAGVKIERDDGVMGLRSAARASEADVDEHGDADGRLFRRKELARGAAPPTGWVGSRMATPSGRTRAAHVRELREHRGGDKGRIGHAFQARRGSRR